jgi:hypothetical protein
MINEVVSTIKMTARERQYALALSKRVKYPCPRPSDGSIAHALKSLLHERAEAEGVPLEGSSKYFAIE